MDEGKYSNDSEIDSQLKLVFRNFATTDGFETFLIPGKTLESLKPEKHSPMTILVR